ncbi:MAG: hypothetical protein KDA87_00640 [Planctomycetales bacterium]|nr:hypothetical protein [Planctomycetales bacterium]
MRPIFLLTPPRFELGSVYVTAGIRCSVDSDDLLHGFMRHVTGDWGDLCEEDRQANEQACEIGTRILSSYTDRNQVRFWIITEADRSATTALLPDEY